MVFAVDGPPAVRLDALERIAEEHREALARITAQSVRALQEEDRRALELLVRALQRENERLTEEVCSLRRVGIRRMVGDAPTPPLPQVPSFLECCAPAGGPPRFPLADLASPFPPTEQTWRETKRRGPRSPAHQEVLGEGDDLLGTPVHQGTGAATIESPTGDDAEMSELHSFQMLRPRGNRADPAAKLRSAADASEETASDWPTCDTATKTVGAEDCAVLQTNCSRFDLAQSQGTGNMAAQMVKGRHARKQRLRLRNLLGLSVNVREVTAEMLHGFLLRRDPATPFDYDDVVRMITELRRVGSEDRSPEQGEFPVGHIDLRMFVELILDQDIVFRCRPATRDDMDWFTKNMLAVTLEEIIDDATMLHGHALEDDAVDRPRRQCPSAYSCLTVVVALTVVFNIVCLGLSMDYSPDSLLWFFIEVGCAIIFCVEAGVKIWKFGAREYFLGRDRAWNLADCLITFLSVLDVGLTLIRFSAGPSGDETAARLVLLLRALRLARVIRLVKLLRTRFLTNLVNMLTGFLLGLPALMWVVVLFLVVLFIFGLAFRIMWGPGEGQNLTAVCGNPDVLVENPELMTPECEGKLHWLYGEAFFGSVGTSMFTTFRFMLGDYQSRNGVSLAVVFGDGYGNAFRLAFAVGMILVVFGLFNIVTAIFVDSTISGLKHNDTMRKYAQQYESRYVRGKLTDLAERIGEVVFERTAIGRVSATSATSTYHGRKSHARTRTSLQGIDDKSAWSLDSIALTCDEFVEVMEDIRVRELLRDLDVEMYNAAALFDTFDGDESGTVTIPEMVQAIMRLRGEVRKNDLIASLVAVRSLGRRFDELMLCLPSNSAARMEMLERPRTT